MFERDGQFFKNDRTGFLALKALITPGRTAVRSGLWSDASTWGGTVPRAGENVLIPLGKDVTYDVNAPNTVLGTVVVDHGAFRVSPAAMTAIHLHTMIVHGGILQIGKPNEPVVGKFTMTFADQAFVSGDTAELGKQLLTMDARVSIIGKHKIPFARASAGISAGATSITLLDDVDPETGAIRHTASQILATWAVGDRVSIPTTSGYNSGDGDKTTVGTIASISGSSFTLKTGAKAHPALSDMSNMPGTSYGIRKKYTFKRTPWILNETRSILFKSQNPGTNSRRACLMFMGNHPPRNIGGHRDDLHKSYTDLGPDKDQRLEFRYFAMEGLGRTQALSSPQVGQPGNRVGRWPFHAHHVGHWAMGQVICQGLVLTDFNMWGYTHDDAYLWYDWCIARDGVGSAFTCIMDTEMGDWTRCFAADVRAGGGGGEFVPSGHGRDGHGYTPARQIKMKEIYAANCRYAIRLNQNETDPLMGGYWSNLVPFNNFSRWPDREAIKRIGGWASDMALMKTEDPMMGNWDDFEFFSCSEGLNIFHRNMAYSHADMRSFFHRWNVWRVGTPINTPNYTWNYSWRDSVFSNGGGFWKFGDKLSGFVFWNCHVSDFSWFLNIEGPNVHNEGGGFIDVTLTNVPAKFPKPSNPPVNVDMKIYNSDNRLWTTAAEAHQVSNLTVQQSGGSQGQITGSIRDLLVGLVQVDNNIPLNNNIPLGYFTVGANPTAPSRLHANQTGLINGLPGMTAPLLVEQNGVWKDNGTWKCRIWLTIRDRMTGDLFYHSLDRNIGGATGVTAGLLAANDIGSAPGQPNVLLAPNLANLPVWPDAVSYLLDPVHPVTYRAVTNGANVSVVMEASNRFLDRAVGNNLTVTRTLNLRDGSGAQTTAALAFDVTAIGAAPTNTSPPVINSLGVPIGPTHPSSVSKFNFYCFRLDRGRWQNIEGAWFEAQLLKNGSVYSNSNGSNPAIVRYWNIEPPAGAMTGNWQLRVRFHNERGSSSWATSNTVTIT